MSNVIIDREKIDLLANAIATKSGEELPLTLAEMVEAVDGIEAGSAEPNLQSKTYTVDSAGTATVTADSGYDGLSEVDVSVPYADFAPLANGQYSTISGERKWVLDYGGYAENAGWVNDGAYGEIGYYSCVPKNTTVTPTTSAQTIGGANYMMEGAVTVAAMPSGTAGTPTATKGTVSNHAVTVTPSVTNTGGYITGSTKTGTAVSVSASELVSGTYSVTSSGTKDVTNYASASVPSGTAGTPSASKGAVSNHSVSVTPSVTNTTGWITGSTKSGTAVTVTAAELVSGSETKTENGTYDVTNLSELVVNVSGGGSVTWETVYDGNVTIVADRPNYVVINNWVPTHPIFADGQTWRITWNGTEYVCPVKVQQGTIYIGNAQLVGYSDTSNEPFFGYMRTSTQLAFVTTDSAGSITLKMELQHDTSATLIEKTITANGTYDAEDDDADGYSSVTVNVPTGTPTIQSLTVNPSTTQQTFNASGVDGYKPVTVSAVTQTNLTAANIKSGTTVTISNGTSNIYSVTGTYSGGSSKNTQIVQSTTRTNASTLTAIGAELTVSKTGTYDIYYSCFRTNTSSSYTWATRLYINGTAYGTAESATWTNNQQNTHLSNISLTAGDKLRVYGRNTRGTSYYVCAPMLVIIEA